MKDDLFSKTQAPAKFEFDESVARVFDDMLERSIPLYRECQDMAVDWCLRLSVKGSNLYDLGCSTGALLGRLAARLPENSGIRLIGIDNSAPMLDKARAKLQSARTTCDLVQADLDAEFELCNASVVVLNYTLQFIAPERRSLLLRRIQRGLNPGGGLILIEKVIAESPIADAAFLEFHHRFKRDRGYSELEISRKREALEKVLTPLTLEENRNLLQQAGFGSVEIFFKWNNFAGLVALK